MPQAAQFIINSPAAYNNGAQWQMGGGPQHELEDPVALQPNGRNGREVIGNAAQRAGRYSSPAVPVTAYMPQQGGFSTRNVLGRGQGQSSMRNLIGATMGTPQTAVLTVRLQQQSAVEVVDAAPEPDAYVEEE